MTRDVSRRSVLAAGVGAAAALVSVDTLFAPSAGAAVRRATAPPEPVTAAGNAFTGRNSPNGWPINTAPDAGGSVWTRPVVGTGTTVQVSIGAAELILVHVIRRFHYEIDTLGANDVAGFRTEAGLRGYQLNHASGTAVDIRSGTYPVGVRGGFFAPQLAVIRDILADCEGVVRWGGDFRVPDEAHFQIDVGPDDLRVTRLVAKLRDWKATPGLGAGVIQDPADRHRRTAALRVERLQNP